MSAGGALIDGGVPVAEDDIRWALIKNLSVEIDTGRRGDGRCVEAFTLGPEYQSR